MHSPAHVNGKSSTVAQTEPCIIPGDQHGASGVQKGVVVEFQQPLRKRLTNRRLHL